MSHLEDLSGEILMAIFEYMDVEDIWKIFFHMNSRFNSIVFDSHLRLTADMSKIEKYDFDQFCQSLFQSNFNNIHALILSNNYYRYPQIRQFLLHTNLTYFQSLHSLTLIDINYAELMEITQQIKQLNSLNHLHIHTHEIFRQKELAHVTRAVFEQPTLRVLGLGLYEKIACFDTETLPVSLIEVLSLNFINIDRLFSLLSCCPHVRSLSMILDTRHSASSDSKDETPPSFQSTLTFPQVTHLRFYFRYFNESVLQLLLGSLPSVKRVSIDTFIYKSDHIRAPFWTLLFQQRLLLLERIRLVVRADCIAVLTHEAERQNLLGGYKYDRYWLDRAHKKIFTCSTGLSSVVLQVR